MVVDEKQGKVGKEKKSENLKNQNERRFCVKQKQIQQQM
jgi:hypothetical protein